MNDNEAISYGRYLKSVRLERGMTMKQVAAVTRVSRDVLEAIEAEDHERLPAEVFVRGFIRSYAKTVGADGERAVRSYEKRLASVRLAVKRQTKDRQSRQSFWPRLAMGLSLMALIAFGSILFLSSGGGDGDPGLAPASKAPQTPPATAVTEPERTAPSDAPSPVAATPPTPSKETPTVVMPKPAVPSTPAPETPPEPLAPEVTAPQAPLMATTQRLVVTAVEETWLKVITDGMRTTEYMLKTGDLLQLEAENGFNLLIGNAAGISMVLNGKEIPVSGRRGQVITMQVP